MLVSAHGMHQSPQCTYQEIDLGRILVPLLFKDRRQRRDTLTGHNAQRDENALIDNNDGLPPRTPILILLARQAMSLADGMSY